MTEIAQCRHLRLEMPLTGTTFQGQEKQIGSDYVQFKWRLSDPLTGRFLSVDPLSEKYAHNSTYAFSENKVIGHIELEGLESVSAIVMGKAQNACNGIANRLSGAANATTSYLNKGSNAISNALTPVDGIPFYSTNNDIKGKGGGMRQSQFPTGEMVEIDPILGAAGAATADPSKALISGASTLGKIISAVEMIKEALGFGQSAGDAINSALPNKSDGTEETTANKPANQKKVDQRTLTKNIWKMSLEQLHLRPIMAQTTTRLS